MTVRQSKEGMVNMFGGCTSEAKRDLRAFLFILRNPYDILPNVDQYEELLQKNKTKLLNLNFQLIAGIFLKISVGNGELNERKNRGLGVEKCMNVKNTFN